MKTFTRNYNGEPIKANEVMVPFEYTELDAETVTNPECISTIKVGGKAFRMKNLDIMLYQILYQEMLWRTSTN